MATPINDNAQQQLNVCFIGHVDSGKSTAVGNLAYMLGAVDKRTMEKYEKEAAANNKTSFAFAYVTDKTAAEKARGITITTTLINIKTSKFNLNILDCPGHKDFIKNMVTGAAQADVGVPIVPASGFEACVGEGGTLKSHITIAGVLGCSKLIVCVNKMDEVEESKRAERFNEISAEMSRIVKRWHPDKNPIIIPISAFRGINLVKSGEKFPWFKGWRKDANSEPIFTLEEALDSQSVPPRFDDKPLRMPIVSLHKIPGIGMVYTGRVDSGKVRPNLKVSIQPADVDTEVKTTEVHREARTVIVAGENCGIAFKNPSRGDMSQVKAGNVISEIGPNAVKMYPGALARIIVVDRKGEKGISAGYIPIMDLGTVHVPVKIAKIVSKTTTNKETIENPESVANYESFVGVLIPQKPTVMEAMKDFSSLARFAIRDSNAIVCIGSIMQLLSADELSKTYGIEVATKAAEDSKKKKGKK